MKIVEKAWELNTGKIEEGFLLSEKTVYSNSRNEAKQKILEWYKYDDLKLRYDFDDVTYLNIPITRSREYDKVLFEGEVVCKADIPKIKEKLEKEAEFERILNDPKIVYCYIRKNGYYYRPNSGGYTEYVLHAGIYTKQEAVKSARSCDELSVIPIDEIVHNEMIETEIENLKKRLIEI